MTETGDLRFRQLLHHAATEELIAELRARGALEALGPAKAAAAPAGPAFELAQQYARNRAGLSALGFTDADSIPPYDLIARYFDPELAQWLNSRRAIGHHDELVLSPSLQQFGLFGSNGLWARVTRLFTADKVRLGYPDMWKETYADGIADHSGGTRWLAAIALGDMLDPRNLSQPANQHGEPGLVYTNADAAAQRGRLQQESAARGEEPYPRAHSNRPAPCFACRAAPGGTTGAGQRRHCHAIRAVPGAHVPGFTRAAFLASRVYR